MKAIRLLAIGLIAAFAATAVSCDKEQETTPEPEVNGTYDDSALKFSFTITDITEDSATVKVSPSDAEAPYYTGYAEAALIAADYNGDVEACFKAIVAAPSNPALATGDRTFTATGLTDDTEYVVFAGAVRDGKVTSPVQSELFTTEKAAIANPFTVAVSNITGGSASIAVSPDNADAYYYFDVIEKAYFDEYYSAADVMKEYLNELKSYIDQYGYRWVDILSHGDDEYDIMGILNPETDYIVFSGYISTQGEMVSDVFAEEFTTKPLTPSNNTFTVTEENAIIRITPSNNDPYVWDIAYTSELEGLTDDEILVQQTDILIRSGLLSRFLTTGPDYENFYGAFMKGQAWTIIVWGYDGGITTPLTRYDFIYGEGDDEGDEPTEDDATFYLYSYNITDTSATISVYPSDNSVPYYFDVISKTLLDLYYNGDMELCMDDKLAYHTANIESGFYTWDNVVTRGHAALQFNDLTPDTEYIIYAGAVRSGKRTSTVSTEKFYTEAEGTSQSISALDGPGSRSIKPKRAEKRFSKASEIRFAKSLR